MNFRSDEKANDVRDPRAGEEGAARPSNDALVQRKVIQRKADGGARGGPVAAGGSGSALPHAVQSKMERSFGTDFSDVRAHVGAHPSALGARAYTQGSDLHFAPGQYAPESASGEALVGHELTHVVQQRAGRVALPQGKDGQVNDDPSLEGEADSLGARAARGESVQVSGSSAGLQRKTTGSPIQLDKEKDGGFATTQLVGDARISRLVTALGAKDFDAVANALEGATLRDDASRKTFVAAWNADQKKRAQMEYMAGNWFAALDDRFKTLGFSAGQYDYLIDVARNGRPSPVSEVKMALGLVTGKGSYNEEWVLRTVEKAPETVGMFVDARGKAMTWPSFWAAVQPHIPAAGQHHDLLRRLPGATDDRVWDRIRAFADAQTGKYALEQAEHAHEQGKDRLKELTEARGLEKESKAKSQEADNADKEKKEHEEKRKEKTAEIAEKDEKHGELQASEDKTKTALSADQERLGVAGRNEQLLSSLWSHAVRDLNRARSESQAAATEAGWVGLQLATIATPKTGAPVDPASGALQERARQAKEHARELRHRTSTLEREYTANLANSGQVKSQIAQEKERIAHLEAEIRAIDEELAKLKETLQKLTDEIQQEETAKGTEAKTLRTEASAKKTEAAALETKNKVVMPTVDALKPATDPEAVLGVEMQEQATENTRLQTTASQSKNALLASKAQVRYLAQIVRTRQKGLNDLDPEALDEIREWTKENAIARNAAVDAKNSYYDSAFVDALSRYISKERDRQFLTALVRDDHTLRDTLVLTNTQNGAKGLDDADVHEEQLRFADAMFVREEHKKDKGKGKKHSHLKSEIDAMSPEAREQYLSYVGGASLADLQDPVKREAALGKVALKLTTCGVTEPKEVAEILEKFRVRGAGGHVSRLRYWAASAHPSKHEKELLSVAAQLQGDEYAQVRGDSQLITDLSAKYKNYGWDRVAAILGIAADGSDAALPKDAGKSHAQDQAELSPKHWSTLLDLEIGKNIVSYDQNKVYLIAHRAQAAASRNAVGADGKPTGVAASDFLRAVVNDLAPKSREDLEGSMPDLYKAMLAGDVTSQLAVASVTRHHLLGIQSGPLLWVNKEDFVASFSQTSGKELLDTWSNIQVLRDELAAAKTVPEKNEIKRTFVLDVEPKKLELIQSAFGNAKYLGVANKLRAKLKEAAERDPAFKKEAADAGYENSWYGREQIELRGLLEAYGQRQSGVLAGSFDRVSNKGSVDRMQAQKVRATMSDAQTDMDATPLDATGGHDAATRDGAVAPKTTKRLGEDQESLKESGEAFEKLKEKTKDWIELAVTIILLAALTAATAGSGGIAAGALMGIKIAVAVSGTLLKAAAAKAIDGDGYDSRGLILKLVTDLVGGAAGFAGSATTVAISGAAHGLNKFGEEAIKASFNAIYKTASQQAVKKMAERNIGDVTLSGSAKAALQKFLTGLAAGEVYAGAQDATAHATGASTEKFTSGHGFEEHPETPAEHFAKTLGQGKADDKEADFIVDQVADTSADKAEEAVKKKQAAHQAPLAKETDGPQKAVAPGAAAAPAPAPPRWKPKGYTEMVLQKGGAPVQWSQLPDYFKDGRIWSFKSDPYARVYEKGGVAVFVILPADKDAALKQVATKMNLKADQLAFA